MGSRNEEARDKFLESPSHAAMLRAVFPEAVFIPKERQIKIPVFIKSAVLHSTSNALLDSGATDNFISPLVITRFNIPTYQLPKPKKVRNVDGTPNSIGPMTHAANLEIQHNDDIIRLCFLIANLGSDSILLGMPFFAAFNPDINWTSGTFQGSVIAFTSDAEQWTPEINEQTLNYYNPEIEDEDLNDFDFDYIPSNERDIVQLGRTTTATELAIKAQDKTLRTWQEQVPKAYHKFKHVFSDKESQRFPEPRPWDHAIDLLPDAPSTLNCKIYPLPHGQQEELDKFLNEHTRKGYICRSNSPYASPFFFIKKKNGKLRPVQDYRRLNEYTVKNTYPLPLIKELIIQLINKKWFTKLDIRWGYNNIRIKDGDQWKTAFKTNRGLFECMVMFFGLTNSPATFQTMMDALFKEEITAGRVIIYMDDILIITESDDLNDHIQMVTRVLQLLEDNDLFLNPEKCHFHKREVEYLGVIVGKGQIKMDPIKVQGLTDWPTPTNVKELRSFLGFGNYYKDFIVNYSRDARPLHELTRKQTPWSWGPIQETAFNTLKAKFTSYPVLRNPDPFKQYIVDTDASAFALGATISQDFKGGRHPIAYYSKSLLPAE